MFKFLDPTGCTYRDREAFQYNLPQRGERWSAWTEHPEPAESDEAACGPGRLHLMKSLNAQYTPVNWWPWWAEGRGLISEDDEKTAYAAVRLRRISPRVFARALRPPFDWGRDANLCRANLSDADLCGANLCGADLRWADLCGADLCGADLCGANLRWADLCGADLCGANLSDANLRWADLCGADLCGANLSDANLCGADLRWADLCGADLCGANLRWADLHEVKYDTRTTWPEGFDETKL